MTPLEVQDLLRRHDAALPEPELLDEVLTAARRSLAGTHPPALSERVWFSRTMRLGWAAAMVALVVIQLVVVEHDSERIHATLSTMNPRLDTLLTLATSRAEVTKELGLELAQAHAPVAANSSDGLQEPEEQSQ